MIEFVQHHDVGLMRSPQLWNARFRYSQATGGTEKVDNTMKQTSIGPNITSSILGIPPKKAEYQTKVCHLPPYRRVSSMWPGNGCPMKDEGEDIVIDALSCVPSAGPQSEPESSNLPTRTAEMFCFIGHRLRLERRSWNQAHMNMS